MRGTCIFLALSLMLCTRCAPVFAQEATTASATQDAEAHWRETISRLGSDDFKVRDAAQKELAKTTWREMALLKKMAASATDEEVKARLLQRVTELEEENALNPLPISIDVKNASLAQVTTALSDAMGAKIESWPPDAGGRIPMQGSSFTLKMQDQPFWEVFRELNRQRGVALQGFDGLRLMLQEPGRKNFLITGGVAVFPISIQRSKNVNLQQDPGKQLSPEQLNIQFEAAIDPRIVLAKYTQPTLLEAIDDAGNILWKQPDALAPHLWDTNGRMSQMLNTNVSLTIPEKPGKKIASAKVQIRLVVQVTAQSMMLAEVEKKLNQPVTIAGHTVTFTRFRPDAAQHQISFEINVADDTTVIRRLGGDARPVQESPPVAITFIDGNGKRIWSTAASRGGTGGSCGGDFVEPVKVELSVPTRTKDVTLTFEFKDLPLP